jgi:hypothetical protein
LDIRGNPLEKVQATDPMFTTEALVGRHDMMMKEQDDY